MRPFTTTSKYLSLVLPKLYCLTNSSYLYINIFLLEYLLYSKVILEYDIPIIYRDYDWNEYKKFINDNDISVVFDCTGGRLKTDLFKNINSNYIQNIEDSKINKKLFIDKKNNLVHLIDISKTKFKKNYHYVSFNIYDEDFNFIIKDDFDIKSIDDLNYFKK